jgi:hypothetical protein
MGMCLLCINDYGNVIVVTLLRDTRPYEIMFMSVCVYIYYYNRYHGIAVKGFFGFMVCMTDRKTIVSFVCLATVMTHSSFFCVCNSWQLLFSHVEVY